MEFVYWSTQEVPNIFGQPEDESFGEQSDVSVSILVSCTSSTRHETSGRWYDVMLIMVAIHCWQYERHHDDDSDSLSTPTNSP